MLEAKPLSFFWRHWNCLKSGEISTAVFRHHMPSMLSFLLNDFSQTEKNQLMSTSQEQTKNVECCAFIHWNLCTTVTLGKWQGDRYIQGDRYTRGRYIQVWLYRFTPPPPPPHFYFFFLHHYHHISIVLFLQDLHHISIFSLQVIL